MHSSCGRSEEPCRQGSRRCLRALRHTNTHSTNQWLAQHSPVPSIRCSSMVDAMDPTGLKTCLKFKDERMPARRYCCVAVIRVSCRPSHSTLTARYHSRQGQGIHREGKQPRGSLPGVDPVLDEALKQGVLLGVLEILRTGSVGNGLFCSSCGKCMEILGKCMGSSFVID